MTLLVVLGMTIFLIAAGAAVATILYPDGDALDQDNRRIAAEAENDAEVTLDA